MASEMVSFNRLLLKNSLSLFGKDASNFFAVSSLSTNPGLRPVVISSRRIRDERSRDTPSATALGNDLWKEKRKDMKDAVKRSKHSLEQWGRQAV